MHHYLLPIAGVSLALLLWTLLALPAKLIFPTRPVFGFVLVLAVSSVILATQAITGLRVTSYAVALLLVILSAISCFKQTNSIVSLICGRRRTKFLVSIVTIYVAVRAAIPTYRYDQLNYHLVVSKYVDTVGRLPDLVFDDHVYFTGSYEFIVSLFRILPLSDITVLAATNVFSIFTFLTILFGAIHALLSSKPNLSSIFFLSILILFLLPDFAGIANAKPDYHLLPLGLLVLSQFPFVRQSQRSLCFGFLLALPLAFKITWVVFAASVGVVFIARLIWLKQWSNFFKVWLGFMSGLSLALVPIGKTWYFLGNPIHPAQKWVFRSKRWSDDEAMYWREVNDYIASLSEYFLALPNALNVYLSQTKNILLAGLIFFLISIFRRVKRYESGPVLLLKPKVFHISCLSLLVYLLFWPLAFGQSITFVRLKEAAFGFAIVGLLYIIDRSKINRVWFSTFVALMIISFSGIDNVARQVMQYYTSVNLEDYFGRVSKTRAQSIYNISQIVNEHRSRFKIGPKDFEKALVAANTPMKYYFDSRLIRVDDYNFNILLKEKFPGDIDVCIWKVFKTFDLRYLVDFNYKGTALPPIFAEVVKVASPISKKYPIYYLSLELLGELERNDCHSDRWRLEIKQGASNQ